MVKTLLWMMGLYCEKGFSMSVFIIAEAGVNHNGDIDLAKKLIDVASACRS